MFTFRKKKWHSARHVGNAEEHSMIHQTSGDIILKLVAKPKHKEVILMKHIVYKHIDRVGEDVQDRAKIQYVSPQLPRKCTAVDEAADIIMLEKLDKEMRPFLGGSAKERKELNAQLEERMGITNG